jgi:hypothetical protein|tara:strand:+ start:24935 stop:25585 length:651 start_codon:yes stop_codon:yes gene_type:complete
MTPTARATPTPRTPTPTRRTRSTRATASIARATRRAREEGGEASVTSVVVQRGASATARACVVAVTMAMTTHADVARAFSGEIVLDDVSYEQTQCPPNQYMPSKGKTSCLKFTATATNASRKKIESANVFGFVSDVDGNSAATVNPDGSSRTVLSAIKGEVPNGTSRVEFIVTVFNDSLAKGPLKLKGFKAVGSVADIDKRFTPFDACEMDPESCY